MARKDRPLPEAAPASFAPKLDLPPKRVLVKEVNWLGDVVMSLPALRAVRASFPEAKLSVLVKQELASFFDGFGWLDEVLPYKVRKGWAGWGDRRRIVGDLRARQFDLAVLFPNSFESAFWPALAGVPRRAGFARDARGLLLTHKTGPTAAILEVHQVHYYLHMLRHTLGVEGDPKDFAVDVSAAHTESMRAWLAARRKRPAGKLVALAVAAAYGPAKEWPAARFAALADLLARRHGAECVLVGAPNERRKSDDVAALTASGALVAAGETSVGEALALLNLCDAFAGNDSGSMHVAGALGKPTVGIYGSTRADRTGPLGERTRIVYKKIECSPCLQRTCRYGHYDCLNRIEAEEVCAELERLGVFG
ncbi:MAG: lipopolysaccharide heptosyltransferase II [Planctomycetes bacterium]|nr:lipopolysaccharide heptosyltransferase II [Planctomycetota bacterium]